MADYENNAFFWQKIDTLFLSGKTEFIKKKGDTHAVYKNLVYPTDYGHISDVKSVSDSGASVYGGSGDRGKITALIIACDILARELDVKLLVGCNEDEIMDVLHFLNQTDYQKTVLIRRGQTVPSWGVTDN